MRQYEKRTHDLRHRLAPQVAEPRETCRSYERLALAELQHRAVNDIAVVGVSLDPAVRGADPTGAAMIAEARARVADLAVLQRLLIPPMSRRLVDAADLLEAVCRVVANTRLRSNGTSLTLRMGTAMIEADTAWLLATAVVELLTNAAKHAFPEGGGNVVLTLVDGHRGVLLRISDDGQGARGARCNSGQGGAILKSLVAAMGARMVRLPPENGTVVEIGIPTASLRRPSYDCNLILRRPEGSA